MTCLLWYHIADDGQVTGYRNLEDTQPGHIQEDSHQKEGINGYAVLPGGMGNGRDCRTAK